MATKEELEVKKLEAEIGKILTETDGARRTTWDRAGDFVKVFGAVVVTLVAGAAAVTTYRVYQAETKLALQEKATADRERQAAEQQRVAAEQQRAAAEQTRDSVSRQVAIA